MIGQRMNFKERLKSKTFWVGLGTVGFGIFQCVKGDSNTGVTTILMGFGMIFGREAIEKSGKK